MRSLLLASTILAFGTGVAAAQTINVSGGGNALQAAISSAPSGATIVITDSATYAPVTVNTPGLTIQAAAGATPVINVPQSASAGIDINANGMTVQGLTITGDAQNLSLAQANSMGANPATTANGINIGSVGGPIITHTQILNNTVAYMPGGGIQSMYADYLTIQGNTVYGNANYSPYGESGISVYASQNSDGSTANKIFVLNNTVYNNKELVTEYGTGAISDGEGIIIDDNSNSQTNHVQYTGGTVVQGNTAYGNGSEGIQVGNSGYVTVTGNNAYGNNTVINGGSPDIATPNSYAVTLAGNTGNPGATPAATTPTATTSATPAAIAQPAGVRIATATAPAATSSAGPVSTCAATPGGAATGGFTTQNGQIIAPDGSPWIAKGIDLYDGAIGSAAQVLATFPGLNFIRMAAYNYSDTASYLSGFISQMSAAHVVVEIEHHVGAGGGVPALTGSALSAENQWFMSIARAFKSDPYVWFGTINEPAEGGGLAAEQTSNYQAIRGAGNNSIIMLSEPIDAGTAGMTNVVIDQHFYGWTSDYSMDQATVTANLSAIISADRQTSGNLPVLIGEYGPSTNGTTDDPNGQQVLNAVQKSGYGSAAWNWDSEAPADNLTQGGRMTSYGQEVTAYIALVANAPAGTWSCPDAELAAVTTLAVAQANAAAGLPTQSAATNPGATGPQAAPPSAPPSPEAAAAIAAADARAPDNAALIQQGDALGAQADALLAGAVAAMGGAK
jgi:parallel beta-helix repeat protein